MTPILNGCTSEEIENMKEQVGGLMLATEVSMQNSEDTHKKIASWAASMLKHTIENVLWPGFFFFKPTRFLKAYHH